MSVCLCARLYVSVYVCMYVMRICLRSTGEAASRPAALKLGKKKLKGILFLSFSFHSAPLLWFSSLSTEFFLFIVVYLSHTTTAIIIIVVVITVILTATMSNLMTPLTCLASPPYELAQNTSVEADVCVCVCANSVAIDGLFPLRATAWRAAKSRNSNKNSRES